MSGKKKIKPATKPTENVVSEFSSEDKDATIIW